MPSALRPHAFACALLLITALAPTRAAMPARVLSLDLCTDRMLATYARPAQVTALSPMHRRFAVDWIDAHWPGHDGSLEQIMQRTPDLVISGEYNARQTRARLQQLGMAVATLPLPRTVADIRAYEQRLLALIGEPAERASTPPPATAREPRPRLLLLGANGIGTGTGTFENELIELAGWRNYLRGSGHLRLDLEQIAADPPDAILWSAPPSAALANRFAEHPVLRRAIPPDGWLRSDFWRWQCPGPWTWELVRQIRAPGP